MGAIHGIFFNDWTTTKVTVNIVGRDGAIHGWVFDRRSTVLMSGTFSELCMPGEVNVLFIPGVVVVIELCMPGAVNVSLVPGGVTLALMLGVLRGVKEVGGAAAGGG
jgi:hypothetical protein